MHRNYTHLPNLLKLWFSELLVRYNKTQVNKTKTYQLLLIEIVIDTKSNLYEINRNQHVYILKNDNQGWVIL